MGKYAEVNLTDTIVLLVIGIPWLKGIALAVGFWQTLFTFFPPYAYYLVIEKYWI